MTPSGSDILVLLGVPKLLLLCGGVEAFRFTSKNCIYCGGQEREFENTPIQRLDGSGRSLFSGSAGNLKLSGSHKSLSGEIGDGHDESGTMSQLKDGPMTTQVGAYYQSTPVVVDHRQGMLLEESGRDVGPTMVQPALASIVPVSQADASSSASFQVYTGDVPSHNTVGSIPAAMEVETPWSDRGENCDVTTQHTGDLSSTNGSISTRSIVPHAFTFSDPESRLQIGESQLQIGASLSAPCSLSGTNNTPLLQKDAQSITAHPSTSSRQSFRQSGTRGSGGRTASIELSPSRAGERFEAGKGPSFLGKKPVSDKSLQQQIDQKLLQNQIEQDRLRNEETIYGQNAVGSPTVDVQLPAQPMHGELIDGELMHGELMNAVDPVEIQPILGASFLSEEDLQRMLVLQASYLQELKSAFDCTMLILQNANAKSLAKTPDLYERVMLKFKKAWRKKMLVEQVINPQDMLEIGDEEGDDSNLFLATDHLRSHNLDSIINHPASAESGVNSVKVNSFLRDVLVDIFVNHKIVLFDTTTKQFTNKRDDLNKIVEAAMHVVHRECEPALTMQERMERRACCSGLGVGVACDHHFGPTGNGPQGKGGHTFPADVGKFIWTPSSSVRSSPSVDTLPSSTKKSFDNSSLATSTENGRTGSSSCFTCRGTVRCLEQTGLLLWNCLRDFFTEEEEPIEMAFGGASFGHAENAGREYCGKGKCGNCQKLMMERAARAAELMDVRRPDPFLVAQPPLLNVDCSEDMKSSSKTLQEFYADLFRDPSQIRAQEGTTEGNAGNTTEAAIGATKAAAGSGGNASSATSAETSAGHDESQLIEKTSSPTEGSGRFNSATSEESRELNENQGEEGGTDNTNMPSAIQAMEGATIAGKPNSAGGVDTTSADVVKLGGSKMAAADEGSKDVNIATDVASTSAGITTPSSGAIMVETTPADAAESSANREPSSNADFFSSMQVETGEDMSHRSWYAALRTHVVGIPADGACLFHAFLLGLGEVLQTYNGNSDEAFPNRVVANAVRYLTTLDPVTAARQLRKWVVDYIGQNKDEYLWQLVYTVGKDLYTEQGLNSLLANEQQEYVDIVFNDCLWYISLGDTYAGDVEITALEQMFGLSVNVWEADRAVKYERRAWYRRMREGVADRVKNAVYPDGNSSGVLSLSNRALSTVLNAVNSTARSTASRLGSALFSRSADSAETAPAGKATGSGSVETVDVPVASAEAALIPSAGQRLADIHGTDVGSLMHAPQANTQLTGSIVTQPDQTERNSRNPLLWDADRGGPILMMNGNAVMDVSKSRQEEAKTPLARWQHHDDNDQAEREAITDDRRINVLYVTYPARHYDFVLSKNHGGLEVKELPDALLETERLGNEPRRS